MPNYKDFDLDVQKSKVTTKSIYATNSGGPIESCEIICQTNIKSECDCENPSYIPPSCDQYTNCMIITA